MQRLDENLQKRKRENFNRKRKLYLAPFTIVASEYILSSFYVVINDNAVFIPATPSGFDDQFHHRPMKMICTNNTKKRNALCNS